MATSWTLYEHPPGTKNWSLSSYRKIGTFSTQEEFASVIRTISIDTNLVAGSYLCLMKDDIPPIYEAEVNKQGGALTIRVPTESANHIWGSFVAHLVSNEVFHKDNDKVAGLIISPKRGNIVIQVWTTEKVEASVVNPVLSNMISSEIMYRSHFERI